MNRLDGETSPYLRQHRHNPVDWNPWGDEAFAEAKQRDVPVLLSVGYSACHWCHVMAHECFEDTETAEMMNRLFVNIKVDREERPDVDAIYMDAVQSMSGRGGWPMTVFCTPDGKPFFGGTYFPRPSFLQLMNAIDDAWRNRRSDIDTNIDALMESLRRTSSIEPDDSLPQLGVHDIAVHQLIEQFDRQWGGFGSPPKFPSTMNLEVVLREYAAKPGDELAEVITTTLDAMASGGMYDHIGGGFSRYSVDEKWLVPHFEKMLYDQALLARTYLHASLVFDNQIWKQVVEEIIEYVLRELTHPDGGFFSAQDADSLDESGHSHEGYFYVWTAKQFRSTLPSDIRDAAKDWYEISEEGNFEGSNIPSRLHHRGDLIRPDDVEVARKLLFESRKLRPTPLLDDKVITEWNALMLSTLSQAAVAYGRKDWLSAAIRNGEFLLRELRDDSGRWLRSWHQDGTPRARHSALASDLAALVDAFTRLGEASGQARWIAHAREVAEQLLDHYWDSQNGGLFTTADDGQQLIVRHKDLVDNATPCANSIAAVALYRLAALTGVARYRNIADQILKLFTRLIPNAPSAFGNLLAAVQLRLVGITEIVVAGSRTDLVHLVQSQWMPNSVLAWGEPYDSPLWAGRDGDRAFVCHDYTCDSPSTTLEELSASLDRSTNSGGE
ncbi:MAG: thioredoxin domain-containing protein [Ilumatobacteraceae bacterium]